MVVESVANNGIKAGCGSMVGGGMSGRKEVEIGTGGGGRR